MQAGVAVPMKIVGFPDEDTVTGAQADIFRHYGISMEGLVGDCHRSYSSRRRACHEPAFWPSTKARRPRRQYCLTNSGRVVDKASREHRQIYPQSGWVEHDAEEIWQNVLTVISEIADRQSTALGELAGLSITNQRETFVVFDRATGKPLHNAIVWQCRRGEPLCQELAAAGHEAARPGANRLKLDTYFPASKIAWLMQATSRDCATKFDAAGR